MRKKIIWTVLIVLILGGGIFAFIAYQCIFSPGINLHGEENWVLYLDDDVTYNDFMDSLTKKDVLKYKTTFRYLAKYKKLPEKIKPGRYMITNEMSNNTLINMLRSGNQSPVRITFNNIRTKEDFAKAIAPKMAFTEKDLLETLQNDSIAQKYNLTVDNIMVIFIPNTYEMYWNISPTEFIDRMHDEYQKFWNNERKSKAENLGYTPVEISILASIVGAETIKQDEMARVAGVYINRLKKGWKLEADPTVIFAMGDFTITRLLHRHLKYPSKYNTYLHEGLPPGPINLPAPYCIDAVLNYEQHHYMYFCAKEDFSGYHNFAVSNAEHRRNARKYQAAYRKWKRKQKKK